MKNLIYILLAVFLITVDTKFNGLDLLGILILFIIFKKHYEKNIFEIDKKYSF